MRKGLIFSTILAVGLGLAGVAAATDTIPVGHLACYTGPTSDVGIPYGNGVADTLNYINKHGGINGKQIEFETVDYSYKAPQAVATYKKWLSGLKPVAIQGWGTADTEALVQFIAQDEIPYYLRLLLGAPDRPHRQVAAHQIAGALQLLLRSLLFRRLPRPGAVGDG